jgi:hypothetical protein
MFLKLFLAGLFVMASPASGAELVLKDGRVFKEWKVMSVSAGYLTIRHADGAARVAKELLPPELLAKFPVDAAALEAEKREIERGRRIAEEQRLATAAREEAAREERAKRYAAAKAREAGYDKQELQARLAVVEGSVAAKAAEDQRALMEQDKQEREARDGLYMLRLRVEMASAIVTMKNVSTGTQTFDWRQMKGRFRKGEVRAATNLAAQDRKFGYMLDPGEIRTFEIGFGSRIIGDGNWLEEISWAEGQWVTYRDPRWTR